MPVGAIIAYAGSTPPQGWLLCDGSDIPSQFPELRAMVGDRTPDLRGYFLRGLDPARKVDPGVAGEARKLLQVQGDGVGPHTHGYNEAFHDTAGHSGADAADLPGDVRTQRSGPPTPGLSETRPKNVAVNYIIEAAALAAGGSGTGGRGFASSRAPYGTSR